MEKPLLSVNQVVFLFSHVICVSQSPRRSWPTRRSSSCPSGRASHSPTRRVTRPSASHKWRLSTSARSELTHTHALTHSIAAQARLADVWSRRRLEHNLIRFSLFRLFDPRASARHRFLIKTPSPSADELMRNAQIKSSATSAPPG